MTRMGAHVDFDGAIEQAIEMEAGVVQLFLGDPQGWKGPKFDSPTQAAEIRTAAEQAGVEIFVHAPYVINVASTNNRIRIPSRKLLQQHVNAAAELGARGVIVHGGHVTKDDDPAVGFENWRKAVDGLDAAVPVLIENTAGGQNAMARHLDRISMLWEQLSGSPNFDHIGFCLDTCHAHAGGEELVGLVDRITAITGGIDLVHCNDSRDAFDSGADRHANLGQGQVDVEGLLEVVRLAGAPLVLETPGDVAVHAEELLWLKENL